MGGAYTLRFAMGSLPAPLLVLLLAAAAAALSAPLTALLVRLGHRAGALDSAGTVGHAKVLRRVPNIGGVSIAATVALPLLAVVVAGHAVGAERLAEWFPALAASARRLPDVLPQATRILLGGVALHLTGLFDDRRALPWLPKLAVQVAVAAGTVLLGNLRVLHFIDASVGGPWLGILVSVAWIVVLVNAINFLDNMDGLAGGVAFVAAVSLAVAAAVAEQWMTAGLLAVLAGALLGFLAFNFPWRAGQTARIFMGDGGSLVVGYLLAVLAMAIVFTAPGRPGYALGTHAYGVFAPLVILAVPLYDACTVTLLRWSQGRSPMVGDQQHFSHRLVLRGLTKRGAVLLICALAAVCGVSGLLLGSAAPWQAALIAAQVAVVLGTIAALERPQLRAMRDEGAR
jgi:UDP-GlcNAc:undecaprenyl-phosphate GlcNAc-1-phosphate transferase